jgi:bifunctional NMN adenylyltransferase/nudix hydrolase
MYDFTVVIGRFQLPHNPHVDLVKHALSLGKHTIVALGSANLRRSLRNPFSASVRIMLIENSSKEIKDAIHSGRLSFVQLEDSVYSDQWWIEHVQRKIKQAAEQNLSTYGGMGDSRGVKKYSECDIALIGHKKDDTSYYLDMFPQWKFEGFECKQVLSATECREAYFKYGLDDKSVQNTLINYTTSGVREALRYIPTQTYNMLKARYEFVENYKKEWGEGPHFTADPVVIKSGHVLLIQRGQ